LDSFAALQEIESIDAAGIVRESAAEPQAGEGN
jgi:hypothetical protein